MNYNAIFGLSCYVYCLSCNPFLYANSNSLRTSRIPLFGFSYTCQGHDNFVASKACPDVRILLPSNINTLPSYQFYFAFLLALWICTPLLFFYEIASHLQYVCMFTYAAASIFGGPGGHWCFDFMLVLIDVTINFLCFVYATYLVYIIVDRVPQWPEVSGLLLFWCCCISVASYFFDIRRWFRHTLW